MIPDLNADDRAGREFIQLLLQPCRLRGDLREGAHDLATRVADGSRAGTPRQRFVPRC